MSKTPYEIRLDLLKLAAEILQVPVHEKRGTLINEWHCVKEQNPSTPHPTLPDFPSTNDIIAEAEKLNKFVSNG
jgi:hypothetical protein